MTVKDDCHEFYILISYGQTDGQTDGRTYPQFSFSKKFSNILTYLFTS